MKRCQMIYFMICIIASFCSIACDPFAIKYYKVIYPESMNNKAIDIDTRKKEDVLNIVENISIKHNLELEGEYYREHEHVMNYYGEYYNTRGIIKAKSAISIRIERNIETDEISLIVTERRRSQSDKSKEIERDLIEAIQKRFGEGSIIPK
jgi:hypothetical protein